MDLKQLIGEKDEKIIIKPATVLKPKTETEKPLNETKPKSIDNCKCIKIDSCPKDDRDYTFGKSCKFGSVRCCAKETQSKEDNEPQSSSLLETVATTLGWSKSESNETLKDIVEEKGLDIVLENNDEDKEHQNEEGPVFGLLYPLIPSVLKNTFYDTAKVQKMENVTSNSSSTTTTTTVSTTTTKSTTTTTASTMSPKQLSVAENRKIDVINREKLSQRERYMQYRRYLEAKRRYMEHQRNQSSFLGKINSFFTQTRHEMERLLFG